MRNILLLLSLAATGCCASAPQPGPTAPSLPTAAPTTPPAPAAPPHRLGDAWPPPRDRSRFIEALDYPPPTATQGPDTRQDCTGAPLFFWAVERDDVARLPPADDARLDATNALGETALHRAARGGHLRVLAHLLATRTTRAAAALDTQDRAGLTPLMAAVEGGQPAALDALIAARARLDARAVRDRTALHLAARLDDAVMAASLVAAGAPLDPIDAGGETPLGTAVRIRATALIPAFVAAGADPLAGKTPDVSPIAHALNIPDERLAHTLLRATAPGDPRLARLWTIAAAVATPDFLAALRKRSPQLDPTDALRVAAAKRRADNVRWLLAAGADPRHPASDGTLPLHDALLGGASDVARALLDAAPDEQRPYQGVPLVGLARRGNVAPALVVRLSPANDPMTMAWLGDAAALAKALDKEPALVDARAVEGVTLLHHAARGGHLAVVQLLLERHAAVGLRTTALGSIPGGDLALVMAVRGGSIPVIELLLDHTAPPDIRRDQDRLMSAIEAHPEALADDLRQRFVSRGHLSPVLRIGHHLETVDKMKSFGDAEGQARTTHRGTGIQLPERADELDVLLRGALPDDPSEPPAPLDPDPDPNHPDHDQDRARDLHLASCLGQGALLEARRLAGDARAARRGPADRNARRLADHNLGRVLARIGAFDDARAAYARALDAWPDAAAILGADAQRTRDPRLWNVLATFLEHRGELALQVANLEDAARDFTAAMPLRRESNAAYRGRPAALLALVETARGNWKTALDLLVSVSAQRVRDLGPVAPQTLAVQNNHAVLLDALGDQAAAAHIFEAQLTFFERTQPLDDESIPFAVAEANVARMRLAEINSTLGQPGIARPSATAAEAHRLLARARARLLDADPLAQLLMGPIDLERGRALAALGRTAEARAAFESALTELERTHGHHHGLVARAELHLAELALARGDAPAARSLLLDAWASAQGMPEETWPIELALGRLEATGQRLASAIFFGKRAVATLQGMRAAIVGLGTLERSFVESRIDAWRQLADWLVAADRLGEATRVMELLKDDEVASLDVPVTRGKTHTRAGAPAQKSFTPPPPAPVLFPAEQEAGTRLTAVSADLASVTQAIQTALTKERTIGLDPAESQKLRELRERQREGRLALERFLTELEAEFATLPPTRVAEIAAMNLSSVTSLQGTLRKLGPGAVLVHYVASPTKLRIMLTTPDGQLARESAIAAADLRALVFRFRLALADPTSDPRPPAQALYNALITPLAADLEAAHAETIVFALDGVLRYIPIAALHDGQNWFIERHRVVLFSRASIDKLLLAPGKAHVAALGVDAQIAGFAQLTEVRRELEGIVKRDASDGDGVAPGVVLLNAEFSRTKLTELLDTQSFSSIHLASHFVFEPGTEADSYLLLGDGDHLTLEDIKLDLRFDGVDLLTLSACNTAVGDDAPHGRREGRELEGFAALTQRLGATAVIATLWSVADQSTADFMRAFYRLRDTAPDLGKAEAMRRAALHMIRGSAELAPADLNPRGGFRPLTPNPPSSQPTQPRQPTSRAHPYYWAPFVLIGNWR